MPSYFFHIKIDLVRPSASAAALVQKDHRFLQSRQGHLHSSNTAGSGVYTNVHDLGLGQDKRGGKIYYESFKMTNPSPDKKNDSITKDSKNDGSPRGSIITTGLSSIYPGLATKASFEPTTDELGYGVVRLFRDEEETPGLYDLTSPSKSNKGRQKSNTGKDAASSSQSPSVNASSLSDEDFTTLCILAVPSWLSIPHLISFLGDEARDNVSHFRMIRTETPGHYMLLMKFRNGRIAREWRKAWNGKVFDSAASTEYCHVVFVRSVEVCGIQQEDGNPKSPSDAIDHRFLQETTKDQLPSIASLGSKPLPPPTRPLKEMPTCPVCLERMDESSGLLTIPCQHTFHCTCLVKWQKNGCPVCRFTQENLQSHSDEPARINECNVCRADVNLWICLICGNTGCGRYDGGHAQLHWKQTGHAFSMDLADQSIWDYDSDSYVHRIMQNKIDGKMMELPSAAGDYDNGASEEDFVPRAKFDAMGAEYTQLLMSQLDSQRAYYERKMEIAADKASQAVKAANQASDTVAKAVQDLSALQNSHDTLIKDTIPNLERDLDRANRRATKFEELSHRMEKFWREEKALGESSHEKITYQATEIGRLKDQNASLEGQKKESEETIRDLTAFISASEKIKQLEDADLKEDLKEGTLEVATKNEAAKDATSDKKKRRRPKNKSRGKGGREDALNALGMGSGENEEEDTTPEVDGKGKQRAEPTLSEEDN